MFICKCCVQNRCFLQGVADELQTNGQPLAVKAARDGEAAAGTEIERQGEDIGQVHTQRIVHALADFEGNNRAIRVFSE